MKLLLNTLQDLRGAVSFAGDLEYSSLKPAIREAQQLVARFVSAELLDELASDTLTAEQKELRELALVPIANLALLGRISKANVSLTDSGTMRTKSDLQNDAFEWQLEGAKAAFRQGAFDGIEELLRYLSRHLDAFPTYRDSDVYKREKSRLIQSAAVFSDYYDIRASRLILSTLDASMRTEERTMIAPLLDDQLVVLLGEALTPAQADLLDAARRALVYLTMARAIREKLVTVTEQGTQVAGISQFATINYRQPVGDKQLQMTIARFDQEANRFLAALKSLLQTETPPALTPTGSRVMGSSIVAF